ncbi:MAG TPA: tripartite tricarboxylate transporter substrate binding protein [Ideonella sp.]|uniref:Bug family tripartite tricarboxylate transporter substrate binding protein n=1 Tax=Ideonella sp. TaxID=1929293 RepID=UPI002C1C095E|nr:tripartite tricarboxylate transporter substrate binding protein [Ideonella sp.]HSI47089.1 tripartite tricarboxylate transporter substrate binding protein [Ideonella sp.]
MHKQSFVAAALACTVAVGVHGQTFPDRPVKVLLPFPAGTGPDTIMRMVGERLARVWGQQVVIENRPGANGWLAMEAAKRAPADGYTLVQVDAPLIAVAPHLWKKLPYDPIKDVEPVATLYRTWYFVTVAADSKWNTVGDLIQAAKAAPGGLSYGSSGVGGNIHLGGAMLEQAAGVKMTHIPYKETPQIYMAISNGDISWAVGTASTTQPMLKARKIKYLAITAPQRSAIFPDVPTVAESQGPAHYQLQTWVSMYAPRGTPQPIVNKINADVGRVLQDPELRTYMGSVGFEMLIQTPAELQDMARKDSMVFKDILKDLKLALD